MKLLGTIAQACPNCGVLLPRLPTRKTRCKSCGLFIYVRTRPQDGLRVLLTEQDAQAVEAQWHQYEEEKAQITPRPDRTMAEVRQALHKQFGRPATEPDVLWRVLNLELMRFSSTESWALYTHVLFEMAELQRVQGQEGAALDLYVQAVHLAMNGPRNIDRELVRAGHPRFSPRGFVPETYLRRVVRAQRVLGISAEQLKAMYLATASRVSSELNLPLPAESTWGTLAERIT